MVPEPPAARSSAIVPAQPAWMPILAYHHVVPDPPKHDPAGNCTRTSVFESQLRWLRMRRYQSVPLSDLNSLFEPGGGGRPALPRRSVVITLDDGYADNYSYAWPLLQRYGFTATIFLVSDAIGGDNRFDAAYGGEPALMLSLDQIRVMQRSGMGFGSHSCSHPASLVDLPDSGLRDELQRSRAVLENLLDAPAEHFSYPHSRLDSRVEVAVERAGYRLACAGVGTRFSQFCLHRVAPAARREANLEIYLQWRRAKSLIKSRMAGS